MITCRCQLQNRVTIFIEIEHEILAADLIDDPAWWAVAISAKDRNRLDKWADINRANTGDQLITD